MQKWYFLEDSENAVLRRGKVDEEEETPSEVESLTVHPPRNWLFRVRATDLRPTDILCVTGSVPELGSWDPSKAIPLECDPNGSMWSRVIDLPSKQVIDYRFCVCVRVAGKGVKLIVRTWEVNLVPRSIGKMSKSPGKKEEPESYGVYLNNGEYVTRIDRGWLTRELVVQLKLCNNPLNIWRSQYENRAVFIKVTPVRLIKTGAAPTTVAAALDECLSSNSQDIERAENAYTEVISLNGLDDHLELQGQFGKEFKPDEMLLFQCTILSAKDTAFLIDFFVYRSKCVSEEPPYHAGFCYLLPSSLEDSEGTIKLPITSTKHRPLGELTLQYLIITPMYTHQCDMSTTYSRHWNKTDSGLDVGHRGSGSSFKTEVKNCAEIRENTVASMRTALESGADMVEFDVQLSKDKVPVIYHDFHVCISLRRKKILESGDMLEIPVKELTLEQLNLLKIYHLTEGKSKNQKFFDEDLEEHQPFPTLKHCFETLEPNCGFNIEIKWTMQLKNNTYELYHPTDINVYLDVILDVVMKHAGNRRIIFSCFNPDVCTMIRLKQNKYPVLFLTQGETKRFYHYKDPRCWSIKSAVQFANYAEILGVNVHTEDILREPSLISLVLKANLVAFCWGDENADPNIIRYLKELGLHGIIYDKIYINSDKASGAVKDSIFLLKARDSQRDLIKQVACDTASAEVVLPSVGEQVSGRVLEVDNARISLGDVSTATSLASLESQGT